MSTRREAIENAIYVIVAGTPGFRQRRVEEQAKAIDAALVAWERNREPSPAEIEAAASHFAVAPGTDTSAFYATLRSALVAARDVRVTESTEPTDG